MKAIILLFALAVFGSGSSNEVENAFYQNRIVPLIIDTAPRKLVTVSFFTAFSNFKIVSEKFTQSLFASSDDISTLCFCRDRKCANTITSERSSRNNMGSRARRFSHAYDVRSWCSFTSKSNMEWGSTSTCDEYSRISRL